MLSFYVAEFLESAADWFAFAFLVYFVMAAAAYRILWEDPAGRFRHKMIQPDARQRADPFRELCLSVPSLVMLAAMLGGIRVLTDFGWTRVYASIGDWGFGYFLFSVVVIAVVHDSYYYFAHRAMHSKLLFRHVHRVHHAFTNPTPFASYAFHPFETVIELAIIGALLLVMPLHMLAIATYYVIFTALNVVSHLGFELYPAWVSRWFITSAHHNLHHTRFVGHYMLLFNIWDRALGTNYPDYHAICERLAMTRRQDRPRAAE
ncbi:MAG TPA: sterol desaturase family protein [Stellaceae bacterium]|nr:sterol desaturase family protein [Stellaceae bacterium]